MIALIAFFTAYAQDIDTIAKLPCGQPSEAQTLIVYNPAEVGPVDRLLGISYRQTLRLADQQAENNIGCTDAIGRVVPSIEATRAGVKAVEQGRMASFETPTANVRTDAAALYGAGGIGGSPFATSGTNLTATVLSFDAALAGQYGGGTSMNSGGTTKATHAAEQARVKAAEDAAEKARQAREKEQELLITGS